MLKNFIDYFIHPQLKVDKSVYERSKISVIAFLVIYLITIIYVFLYFSISNGVYWDVKSVLNYIDVLSTTAAIILIKKTGRINFALTFMAFVYLVLISGSVYVSGGINSYDIYWLIVLSTASYMLISIPAGVLMTTLSIVAITGFYIIEEIPVLKHESNIAQLTLTYKYFNFSLILTLLVLMVYVLVRGNKKLQNIIQLSKEQAVREEIARDFHDQIGNKLASLMHLSELIKLKKNTNEQQQIVMKIDNSAKDLYDNFRDFIWTLDAKSDRLPELFMYLRDFADDYFKFSEVKLFITSTPEQLPNVSLPSAYSKEIVPLFKEAITNIYKHANAKNIKLNFIASNSNLTIVLSDDGKGMERNVLENGIGIKSMRQRAEKTGGQLVFNSVISKGTEIIYKALLPIG